MNSSAHVLALSTLTRDQVVKPVLKQIHYYSFQTVFIHYRPSHSDGLCILPPVDTDYDPNQRFKNT